MSKSMIAESNLAILQTDVALPTSDNNVVIISIKLLSTALKNPAVWLPNPISALVVNVESVLSEVAAVRLDVVGVLHIVSIWMKSKGLERRRKREHHEGETRLTSLQRKIRES